MTAKDSVATTVDGGADPEAATAYDRLAQRIRAQIVSGELRPGDQLPTESELSSQYDVSRNTAREALRALASHGLVRTKRGVSGGTFVDVPSPTHVRESLQTGIGLLAEASQLTVDALVEIREILEVPAAELAALRRTEEELESIRKSLFDPRQVDPGRIYTSTRDFHASLLVAAHNPMLELLAEPIFRVLKERFLRERIPRNFWKQVDREHKEILSFVEASDQAGAREATRAHLRYLRGVYGAIDRYERGAQRP